MQNRVFMETANANTAVSICKASTPVLSSNNANTTVSIIEIFRIIILHPRTVLCGWLIDNLINQLLSPLQEINRLANIFSLLS